MTIRVALRTLRASPLRSNGAANKPPIIVLVSIPDQDPIGNS